MTHHSLLMMKRCPPQDILVVFTAKHVKVMTDRRL